MEIPARWGLQAARESSNVDDVVTFRENGRAAMYLCNNLQEEGRV